MSKREAQMPEWNRLGWPEWEQELEKVWNFYRSRFATTWNELPHHDRVSLLRILQAANTPPRPRE